VAEIEKVFFQADCERGEVAGLVVAQDPGPIQVKKTPGSYPAVMKDCI
jgi:hypothetical protein